MVSKYDSPIGSKQFQGQPMKEFNVPDESGFAPPQHRQINHEMPEFDQNAMREFEAEMQPRPGPLSMKSLSAVEQQMLEAKRAQREGKQRLSEGAKRRINMLIDMVRLTKDVDIDGKLYRLQTLQSKELRDALVATSEFDGSIQLIFETRRQLLGRSLVVVAGVDISEFLSSNELSDRLDFIEMLDHSILMRLYNEYTALAQEAESKYAIKTEQQVKEVLEDLKKP